MELTGAWDRMRARLEGLGRRFRDGVARTGEAIGEDLVERVRDGLASQAPGGQKFAPLSPYTVERKGSDLALAGGDLERSITYRLQLGGLLIWVGVPTAARTRDGTSLGMIARVHEYGMVIDVTDRMRGYLHAQGLHLAAETTTVVIPARPFLGPVLRASGVSLRAKVVAMVGDVLHGR